MVLTFIPFFRHSFPLQTSLDQQESRITGTLNLKLSGKDSSREFSSTLPITFYGPGDIQGINPSAIARVEPALATQDFEPNYFPFIEFKDPDFLWRYSLDLPTAERQQPWLALLCLTNEEMKDLLLFQDADARWHLTLEKRLLSSSQPGWSTAHVQLSNVDGRDIQEFIKAQVDNHCCRLFCFRQLQQNTCYNLFLVPYYLAATSSSENGYNSIFSTNQETLTLPVYYQSYFKTSEDGDFEALAHRLEIREIPEGTGTTPVDAAPSFLREGALAAPNYNRVSYLDQIDTQGHTERVYIDLAQGLANPSDNPSINSDEDPYITLPYYGRAYQKIEMRPLSSWQNLKIPFHWTEELNLDFRNRIATGFGTKVIQKKQDEYLKKCWFQVGDLRLANEKLKRAQAAEHLSHSLDTRYLKPLTNEKFALVTFPYHSHFSYQKHNQSISLKKRLEQSGLPKGLIQPAFARIAKARISSRTLPLFTPWALKNKKPIEPVHPRTINRPFDFPQRAKRALNISIPSNLGDLLPPKKEIIKVKPIDMANQFRPRFDSKESFQIKMHSLIHTKEKPLSPTLDPILSSPQIDDPMYRQLLTLSLDYVLPGIKKIPMNSITLCEENRIFIESFLCGLSDEMGKELILNQFPLEQGATIFNHFWDPTTVEEGNVDDLGNPQALRDICPLREFSKLGTNQKGAVSGRVVLLLKGDLIRRYPQTEIFVLKTTQAFGDGSNQGEKIISVFRGNLGPDILAIGFPFSATDLKNRQFEYYFILQEHQELPRFGLDVGSSLPNFNDLAHSANVAAELLQSPIQLVIHASKMINLEDLS